MTYRLEQFIEKIKSPVVCVFDDKEIEYANGKELENQQFDKYWLVDSISVRDDKILLKMIENHNTNYADWIGEEGIDKSFF